MIALHYDGLSRPLEGARLRVLSLGAGTQSSALLMMSDRGDLPRLDAAIFADTGWEPDKVYRWLDWLEENVSIPIMRVRRDGPDLGEQTLQLARGERTLKGTVLPPFYTSDRGMVPKQCNADFKRDVVLRTIRSLLDVRPSGTPIVEQWLGMSSEPAELQRVSRNRRKYIHNRYPLIEARMSRGDCIRYFTDRQMPEPPKSACVFCPFRSRDQWKDMRDNAPDDWSRAVKFDADIRRLAPDFPGEAFVHRSLTALDQVDLDDDLDTQGRFGFANDCEGLCGV